MTSPHNSYKTETLPWARERIKVYSPKPEHHEGGANREIPLFPELRPYLAELWELAEPGENRVITRYEYNGQNTNLRTQFTKIIRRAGLEPWPKLWQNLRSSRETELTETFPLHVVCKWIGNSEAVAKRHYLQVTDEHFQKAVETAIQVGKEVAQNAAQLAHVKGRKNLNPTAMAQKVGAGKDCDKTVTDNGLRSLAAPCRKPFSGNDLRKVGDNGLEERAKSSKFRHPDQGAPPVAL